MKIYVTKLDHSMNEWQFKRKLSLLPDERQSLIKQYRKSEDADRSFVAGLLAGTVIHQELGLRMEEQTFSKNAFGKPALNTKQPFHFNLSHSGSWVVCAIDKEPIGVDVEQMKPMDIELARRFFTSSEYNDLKKLKGAERLSYFYELWTMKESYIKAVGKGLSIPLNSFSLKPKDEVLSLEFDGEQTFWFKLFDIDNGYKLAVCAQTHLLPDQVEMIEMKSLMT